jgi:ubiquinone/menaquinone biosynthesis C-methylase UbiE
MQEEELKNIAKQLSRPEGESGMQIAAMMNETNFSMTADCIDELELKDGMSVLELGHGNCGHLQYFLRKANTLKYTGLEISPLMSQQAKEINSALLNENIEFLLYEGTALPFKEDLFDAVFTVNTIYFWPNPQEFLSEIYRVLHRNGKLLISFADKAFMQALPFTQYVFTLYTCEEIEKMAQRAGFVVTSVKENSDEVRSKAGDLVTRKFYTMTLNK